jgi:hypothetical protein
MPRGTLVLRWDACAHGGTRRSRALKPSSVFPCSTLEANYGLQDLDQKFWDTWNSLKQGPSQDIAEYNVEFQQALTDLAGHVTDEQIKIKKYCNGLQHDLREMCSTSPAGTRWA